MNQIVVQSQVQFYDFCLIYIIVQETDLKKLLTHTFFFTKDCIFP